MLENSRIASPPKGNILEVWLLSYPLMLTALSGNLMFAIDRMMLGNYSTLVMNGAAICMMAIWPIQFGGMVVTSIAEVFVGQHNGAKNYDKIGQPVWQMIWFALALNLLFVPLAFGADRLVIPAQYYDASVVYYRWIMGWAVTIPMIGALSAFFIGTGRVQIVTIVAVFGNILNIALDYLLIFGVKDYIPSMGAEGAAIATVFSQMIQVVVLASMMFRPKFIKLYGLLKCQINYDSMSSCLKFGLPNSVGKTLEILAWSATFYLVADKDATYISVLSIGQGILCIFIFVTEGIEKGVTALVSNMIGAKVWDRIGTVIKSSIKLIFVISAVVITTFIFLGETLIDLYLSNDLTVELHDSILRQSLIGSYFLLGYLIVDGIVWSIAGVLTAAGDTRFIMVANTFAAWAFAGVPFYFLVCKGDWPPFTMWVCTLFYGSVNLVMFYLRYRYGNWRKLVLNEGVK